MDENMTHISDIYRKHISNTDRITFREMVALSEGTT